MQALRISKPSRTTGYAVGDDSTLYKLPYARKLQAEIGGDLVRVVKVLIRGAYVVQSREIVTPAPVEFVPCDCGATDRQEIGGHLEECAAMIESRAMQAARATQWAIDHPPVFTPHTPATRAQWERDIIAQGGTPAPIDAGHYHPGAEFEPPCNCGLPPIAAPVQAAQPYEIDCEEEDTSAANWWHAVPVATVTPVAAPRGDIIRHTSESLPAYSHHLCQIAENHTMAAYAYARLSHAPHDSRVIESYRSFRDQTLSQWYRLLESGLTVEFHTGDHDYPNSAAMLADLATGHLWTLSTAAAGELPADHPMAAPVDLGTYSRPLNDLFRAVHDALGHGISGGSFGPLGEFAAWKAHRALYSRTALAALWCETRGQSTWTNFYADHASLPLPLRPFADQRAGWPPLALV